VHPNFISSYDKLLSSQIDLFSQMYIPFRPFNQDCFDYVGHLPVCKQSKSGQSLQILDSSIVFSWYKYIYDDITMLE